MRYSVIFALSAYLPLFKEAVSSKGSLTISVETQVLLALVYISRYCTSFSIQDPLSIVKALYIILPIAVIYCLKTHSSSFKTGLTVIITIMAVSLWLPLSYIFGFPEPSSLSALLFEYSYSLFLCVMIPQLERIGRIQRKYPNTQYKWVMIWAILTMIGHWFYFFECLGHPGVLDPIKLLLCLVTPIVQNIWILSFMCCCSPKSSPQTNILRSEGEFKSQLLDEATQR